MWVWLLGLAVQATTSYIGVLTLNPGSSFSSSSLPTHTLEAVEAPCRPRGRPELSFVFLAYGPPWIISGIWVVSQFMATPSVFLFFKYFFLNGAIKPTMTMKLLGAIKNWFQKVIFSKLPYSLYVWFRIPKGKVIGFINSFLISDRSMRILWKARGK